MYSYNQLSNIHLFPYHGLLGIKPCRPLPAVDQELWPEVRPRAYAIYESRLLQVRHGQSRHHPSHERQPRIRRAVIHPIHSRGE